MDFDNIAVSDPVIVDDVVMPAGTKPSVRYMRIVDLKNAEKLWIKFSPSIKSVFQWLFENGVSENYTVHYVAAPVPQDPIKSYVQVVVELDYYDKEDEIQDSETVGLISLLRNPNVALVNLGGQLYNNRYVFPELPSKAPIQECPIDFTKSDPYFEKSYLSVGLPIDKFPIGTTWVEEISSKVIKCTKKLRQVGFRVYHSWELET